MKTEYTALCVVEGFEYKDIASSLMTGVPGILLTQVTVAGAAARVGLNTNTGCGPTSVLRLEKTIVPVMDAVTVSVIVDRILAGSGEAALLATLLQIWNR